MRRRTLVHTIDEWIRIGEGTVPRLSRGKTTET